MKILFIGASGMLGKPVAAQLIKDGYKVTFLAREPNKIRSIFPGSSAIYGDVFDKISLINAMIAQDAVYLNLSVLPTSKQKDLQPEREGINHILAAAKETGIKRIAYLSSLVHLYNGMNGFKWWAFDIKQVAVAKIKASGIPYTIFYPSTFMETFPYQMMQGKKIAMLGRSTAPMWFIAASDYAKQVSRSFQIAGNNSKDYPVQGIEPFTFEEATPLFINNYKKTKLSLLRAPIWLMKFFGNFIPKFNYGWHICEALNKYPEKFESEKTWTELGKPTMSLREYAESF